MLAVISHYFDYNLYTMCDKISEFFMIIFYTPQNCWYSEYIYFQVIKNFWISFPQNQTLSSDWAEWAGVESC